MLCLISFLGLREVRWRIDSHLKVSETVFGSMVELAVEPWAATKLAKSATAIVDFANMVTMG